jgi:hypothetical protein
MLHRRLTYANVMSTLALFVALGGGAYAAISALPGQGGTIRGCYQKKSGKLRVIAAGKKCLKSERVLAWSQRGPAGTVGTAGQPGAAGAAGAAGAGGALGATGAQGATGSQGPVGPTHGVANQALGGGAPSSTPEGGAWATTTIAAAADGRLFVFARGLLSITCSAGNGQAGLYVDDIPVPASGQPVSTTTTPVNIWGVSDPVSAGSHTVKLETDCIGGNATGGTYGGGGAIGAILLGQ